MTCELCKGSHRVAWRGVEMPCPLCRPGEYGVDLEVLAKRHVPTRWHTVKNNDQFYHRDNYLGHYDAWRIESAIWTLDWQQSARMPRLVASNVLRDLMELRVRGKPAYQGTFKVVMITVSVEDYQ